MKYIRLILSAAISVFILVSVCHAVDVVVVADTRLKPVTDILSGMEKSLKLPVRTYPPSRIKGTLQKVVADEEARVVVALGKEALAETLRLPSSVTVVYGLVLVPPATARPNTTGFYMATPAREYLDFLGNHLHMPGQIAVVGSRELMGTLVRGESSRLSLHSVKTPYELASTVMELTGIDAVLLLPDVYLMTSTAMEEVFLYSFRKKIPLLGISEKSVKDGALLALVADPVQMGRAIGDYAGKVLRGVGVAQLPPSPPKKFDLFLNVDTARKMGIRVPEDVLRSAKRIYP